MKILLALLVWATTPFVATAGEPTLISDFRWSNDDPRFGGLSAIWVDETGEEIVAVSDRGAFIRGLIERDDGQISGVRISEVQGLKDHLRDDPPSFHLDAEGIARAKDGSFYVSFEAHHRVSRYVDLGGRGVLLHKWNAFWDLQKNSGMEALAIDAKGMLYAIPERSGEWTRPFPVFRYLGGGDWDRSWSIPREGKYLVTGAEFGPDGLLYVLERDFKWYRGFSTRIRRFAKAEGGFVDGETVLQTSFGALDNMEGISLRRDRDGGIIMTLISDDNFNLLQSTRLVEYKLLPSPADG